MCWKDGRGEMWDSTHNGGTKDDPANDLSDDLGLFDEVECPGDALGEGYDDEELDQEKGDRLKGQASGGLRRSGTNVTHVGGIIVAWIRIGQDARLSESATGQYL